MTTIQQTDTPRLLWTSREAARALSISERKLWGLTKEGKVPCVRIGRAVRYLPVDLLSWAEAQRTTCSNSTAAAEST
jgi:excisionase family DNA binding protein